MICRNLENFLEQTHSVCNSSRENDQDQIDLDDTVCQKIVCAAKDRPCSRLPYSPYSMDLSEADGDVSTPDYTTNSEPEAAVHHLAESERAFSEDAETPESVSPGGASNTAPQPQTCVTVEPGVGDEPRVLYRECEADTSCVVNVEEEEADDSGSAAVTDSSYDDKDYESFRSIVESKSGTV